LLACGLLLHCLQSRHRVNFGVNRSVRLHIHSCCSSCTRLCLSVRATGAWNELALR
jgi:hypothetical protein